MAKVRPMVRETEQGQEVSAARPLVVKDPWQWVVGQFEMKDETHRNRGGSRRPFDKNLNGAIMVVMTFRVAPNTIARRIDFFEALRNGNLPFSPSQALRDLASASAGSKRYVQDPYGRISCSWSDTGASLLNLRVAYIRREDLPSIENNGALSSLTLSPGAGIAEMTHVSFFEERSTKAVIAAIEFNFRGPRATRISYHMRDKAPTSCAGLYFKPLLRSDAARALARLDEIKMLHLHVAIPEHHLQAVVNEENDVWKGLSASASIGSARDVELILRPKRHSRDSFLKKVKPWIQRALGDGEFKENASKLQVTGLSRATGEVDFADLLTDYIYAKKSFVRLNEKTKAVESASAYEEMQKAYQELKVEIANAATVTVAAVEE